jgi:hypothetical protein
LCNNSQATSQQFTRQFKLKLGRRIIDAAGSSHWVQYGVDEVVSRPTTVL